MPFVFTAGWDSRANNDGSTAAQLTIILATANNGTGDAGLRAALVAASNQVNIVKGIHRDTGTTDEHVTVDYLGGRWHVHLIGAANGYRVRNVTQWRG